jgi:hypothetical protein
MQFCINIWFTFDEFCSFFASHMMYQTRFIVVRYKNPCCYFYTKIFKSIYLQKPNQHLTCFLCFPRCGLELWCLTPLSAIFQSIDIVMVSFIGGGNQSTQRKTSTCRKPLTNSIMLYWVHIAISEILTQNNRYCNYCPDDNIQIYSYDLLCEHVLSVRTVY